MNVFGIEPKYQGLFVGEKQLDVFGTLAEAELKHGDVIFVVSRFNIFPHYGLFDAHLGIETMVVKCV